MNLEKYVNQDLFEGKACTCQSKNANAKKEYKNLNERINFGINEAKRIVSGIWLWILVGVGVGSIIHNYIPQETIHGLINTTGIFAVPIATLLGVPMYGNCAAIVPVTVALFNKGIPLGTVLAFMMAASALSLPFRENPDS